MPLSKNDLKQIKALKQKKFRDRESVFIVEGVKIIEEALNSSVQINLLLIKGSLSNDDNVKLIMKNAAKKSVHYEIVGDRDFSQLSSLEQDPGIMAIIERKKPELNFNKSIIILDQIKDPGNLGTIIRTADWFGVNQVLTTEGSVEIYNPKVIQSSMGSFFRVACHQGDNLPESIKLFKQKGFSIVMTDVKGISSGKAIKPFALVMGNESQGLDHEIIKMGDMVYTIPKYGQAESLNVAVSTGIILRDLMK